MTYTYGLYYNNIGYAYPILTNFLRKEEPCMKKYVAPEMQAISFAADEAIAALLDGSSLFNDAEFGQW